MAKSSSGAGSPSKKRRVQPAEDRSGFYVDLSDISDIYPMSKTLGPFTTWADAWAAYIEWLADQE